MGHQARIRQQRRSSPKPSTENMALMDVLFDQFNRWLSDGVEAKAMGVELDFDAFMILDTYEEMDIHLAFHTWLILGSHRNHYDGSPTIPITQSNESEPLWASARTRSPLAP